MGRKAVAKKWSIFECLSSAERCDSVDLTGMKRKDVTVGSAASLATRLQIFWSFRVSDYTQYAANKADPHHEHLAKLFSSRRTCNEAHWSHSKVWGVVDDGTRLPTLYLFLHSPPNPLDFVNRLKVHTWRQRRLPHGEKWSYPWS